MANDGTLIFKHPTIRNYYDKTDKPELKDNPYNTMMNPYYMQGYPGWGPYGGMHPHGTTVHQYGAYGNIPAWNRMNTIARKMKNKRKVKYQASKNSRLASLRDDMASENSYRTDMSFKSAAKSNTGKSRQSNLSPNRSSPSRRFLNGAEPMYEGDYDYED